MVKPQFELGQGRVKGGVVRSARRAARGGRQRRRRRRRSSGSDWSASAQAGVPGPKGNQEVFVQLRTGVPARDVAATIAEAVT